MSNQVVRDKIEGSNGGELGDPEMFAARNIEALQAQIGYRNVMSRQAQQLEEVLKTSAMRKEREMAIKKERKARRAVKQRLRRLDDGSSEDLGAAPNIVVRDEARHGSSEDEEGARPVRASPSQPVDAAGSRKAAKPGGSLTASMDDRAMRRNRRPGPAQADADAALMAAEGLKQKRRALMTSQLA